MITQKVMRVHASAQRIATTIRFSTGSQLVCIEFDRGDGGDTSAPTAAEATGSLPVFPYPTTVLAPLRAVVAFAVLLFQAAEGHHIRLQQLVLRPDHRAGSLLLLITGGGWSLERTVLHPLAGKITGIYRSWQKWADRIPEIPPCFSIFRSGQGVYQRKTGNSSFASKS